jgi:hypothetical protein
LHGWHDHFERAGLVHFPADDFFDFSHDPETERHPGEQSGCQAPDEAGPQHELVTDNLSFRWNLF